MRIFILYFWLCLLMLSPLNAWKMEADSITVNNTTGGVTTHISFRQAFDVVPLVFTLMDDRGGHPASFRITNITTLGFDIYTVEPQGEDGPHIDMTAIPYIAIEPGTHEFPDGTQIVAGTVSTQRFQSRLIAGDSWQAVSLSGFSTTPVVLGQIQSRANERTDLAVPDAVSRPWMTTAIRSVTSSGFDIALERSETTDGTISSDETIAYLAIDSGLSGGNHYFGSNSADKIEYETIRTGDSIQGWGTVHRVDFSKTYPDPIVVATKNTRNGWDGGWLRRENINDAYIQLQLDEDRAYDSERDHVAERAGVLVFSEPFDVEFLPSSSARMLINEVMYNETTAGTGNDEFVELYVTQSGNIEGYILSDQDTHYYKFPSCDVSVGEYVIFHTGSGTNSCSGATKHFYQGTSQYWNNTKDDVLLLRPVDDDVTTTTQGSNPKTFNAIPQDYIAYGSLGGAVDAIPASMNGVTLTWDYGYGGELDNATDGTSIALTPNATDGNVSACWEFSTSGNASDNGCAGYLPTRDSNAGSGQTNSLAENNNVMPNMSISKTSIVTNDPVNGATNPKRIPGATIRYCFRVDNTGEGSADNVTIDDSLTGSGRDNLTYVNSGRVIQSISTACDCPAITDTSGSISGTDVTISLGTITGTGAIATSRACAYIEATID